MCSPTPPMSVLLVGGSGSPERLAERMALRVHTFYYETLTLVQSCLGSHTPLPLGIATVC